MGLRDFIVNLNLEVSPFISGAIQAARAFAQFQTAISTESRQMTEQLQRQAAAVEAQIQGIETTLWAVATGIGNLPAGQTVASLNAELTRLRGLLTNIQGSITHLPEFTRHLVNMQQAVAGLVTQTKNLRLQELAGAGNLMMRGGTMFRSQALAAIGMAAALAYSLQSVVAYGAEFDKQMNAVRSVVSGLADPTGKAIEQFHALNTEIQRLGDTLPLTSAQVAEAAVALGQAGLSAKEIIASLESAVQLSLISGLELGRAAEALADIKTAFGLEAGSLDRVLDVLAKTASAANTSVEQLVHAFSFAAPVAASLGQSVQETSIALAALSNAGIKSSRAGTGLAQILSGLVRKTEDTQALMSKYGSSFDAVNPAVRSLTEIISEFQRINISAGDAMEFFGERAGRALLALTNLSPQRLAELGTVISDNFGEGARQAALRWQEIPGLLAEVVSRFEAIKLGLYNALKPLIGGVLQEVVDWLTYFSVKLKEPDTAKLVATISVAVISLGTMAVVISGLLLFFGSFVTILGTVVTALTTTALTASSTAASIQVLDVQLQHSYNEAQALATQNTALAASYAAVATQAQAARASLAAAVPGGNVRALAATTATPMAMFLRPLVVMRDLLVRYSATIVRVGGIVVAVVAVIINVVRDLAKLASVGEGKFGMLTGVLTAMWDILKYIGQAFTDVYTRTMEFYNSGIEGSEKLSLTQQVLYSALESVRQVLELLKPLAGYFGAVLGGLAVAIATVISALVNAATFIVGTFIKVVSDAFLALFTGPSMFLKRLQEGESVFTAFKDAAVVAFGELYAAAVEIFGGLVHWIDWIFGTEMSNSVMDHAQEVRDRAGDLKKELGITPDSQKERKKSSAEDKAKYEASSEKTVLEANLLDKRIASQQELIDLQSRYGELTSADLKRLAKLKDEIKDQAANISTLTAETDRLIEAETRNKAAAEDQGNTEAVKLHQVRIDMLNKEKDALEELEKRRLEQKASGQVTASAADASLASQKDAWDQQTRDLAEADKALESVNSKITSAFDAATNKPKAELTFKDEIAAIDELKTKYDELQQVRKDALLAKEVVLNTSMEAAAAQQLEAEADLKAKELKAVAEAQKHGLAAAAATSYVQQQTERAKQAKDAADKRLEDLNNSWEQVQSQLQEVAKQDADVLQATNDRKSEMYKQATSERDKYLMENRVKQAEASDDLVLIATLKAQEYVQVEQEKIDKIFDINDVANAALKKQAEQAVKDRAKAMVDEATKKEQEKREKEDEEKRKKLKAQMKDAMSPTVSAADEAAKAAAKQVKSVQDLINLYTVLYKIRMIQEARARQAADRAFEMQQKAAALEAKVNSGKYSGDQLAGMEAKLKKFQYQSKLELAVAGTKLAIAGIDPAAAGLAKGFTESSSNGPQGGLLSSLVTVSSQTYVVTVEIRDLLRQLVFQLVPNNIPSSPVGPAASGVATGAKFGAGLGLKGATASLAGGLFGGLGTLGFSGLANVASATAVPTLNAAASAAINGLPQKNAEGVFTGKDGKPVERGSVVFNVTNSIDADVLVNKFKDAAKSMGLTAP